MTREQVQDIAEKRARRREFFRRSGGFAAGMAGGAVLMACGGGGTGAIAQSAAGAVGQGSGPSDADILNFALNLEYLEAQFYVTAATGAGLPAGQLTGTGTQGAASGGRAVTFTDPVVRQYAKEIAADEAAHVAFLRSALGSSAVAQPTIDIGTSPTGAFSSAARAAGLIGPGQSFDPYASDENFLLAAFIFEDVGVTAYKGASPLIQNKTFLEAAAGILAVEAYHSGLVRSALYAKGVGTPGLRSAADAISEARDSLDDSQDTDQGISPTGDVSNIVPADANGIAFSRTPANVLNIVYLSRDQVSQGGFFPAGVNGALALSSAYA
ncbi:MAG TPA: ferritin-like domain-containing protein [Ramlibacter sp.]|uniref:ferritin-like domain-containing protein n=1 Tax=Ramlibacter sp. TaxID=1917967 RepID=UPI002D6488EE|nr:ferritin-like domain-containing protein [Ramlibacter sp.]HZY20724.1 ferritin-like domain-containing protein [Ramlibacter sp.]